MTFQVSTAILTELSQSADNVMEAGIRDYGIMRAGIRDYGIMKAGIRDYGIMRAGIRDYGIMTPLPTLGKAA